MSLETLSRGILEDLIIKERSEKLSKDDIEKFSIYFIEICKELLIQNKEKPDVCNKILDMLNECKNLSTNYQNYVKHSS